MDTVSKSSRSPNPGALLGSWDGKLPEHNPLPCPTAQMASKRMVRGRRLPTQDERRYPSALRHLTELTNSLLPLVMKNICNLSGVGV